MSTRLVRLLALRMVPQLLTETTCSGALPKIQQRSGSETAAGMACAPFSRMQSALGGRNRGVGAQARRDMGFPASLQWREDRSSRLPPPAAQPDRHRARDRSHARRARWLRFVYVPGPRFCACGRIGSDCDQSRASCSKPTPRAQTKNRTSSTTGTARLFRAPVPHLSGCACETHRGTRGDHRAGDLSATRFPRTAARPKPPGRSGPSRGRAVSQAAVARLLGVSRQYVTQWLRGRGRLGRGAPVTICGWSRRDSATGRVTPAHGRDPAVTTDLRNRHAMSILAIRQDRPYSLPMTTIERRPFPYEDTASPTAVHGCGKWERSDKGHNRAPCKSMREQGAGRDPKSTQANTVTCAATPIRQGDRAPKGASGWYVTRCAPGSCRCPTRWTVDDDCRSRADDGGSGSIPSSPWVVLLFATRTAPTASPTPPPPSRLATLTATCRTRF